MSTILLTHKFCRLQIMPNEDGCVEALRSSSSDVRSKRCESTRVYTHRPYHDDVGHHAPKSGRCSLFLFFFFFKRSKICRCSKDGDFSLRADGDFGELKKTETLSKRRVGRYAFSCKMRQMSHIFRKFTNCIYFFASNSFRLCPTCLLFALQPNKVATFYAIGLYRDVWIAAIASSTTSLATRTAAICVRFQGRRVRHNADYVPYAKIRFDL